jgi:uncharacterized membrane protein
MPPRTVARALKEGTRKPRTRSATASKQTQQLRVLYLGDHKGGSARYVTAALNWAGFGFEHHDATEKPPAALLSGKREWDIVILSDYPSQQLGRSGDRHLSRLVSESGVGLLMIGGWASFTGNNGGYRGTEVGSLLPVRMQAADDRRNVCTGLVLWPVATHPLIDGLSFRRPPVIAGYNAVLPRTTAQVLLSGIELKVRGRGRQPQIMASTVRPMLVVSEAGKARTTAFATDLAPHWCGGLVDWGRSRVHAGEVEVGEQYLDFIARLVRWTAG